MQTIIEYLTSIKSNSSTICIPKCSRADLSKINSNLIWYFDNILVPELQQDYRYEAKILEENDKEYIRLKVMEARYFFLSNLSLLIASNQLNFEFIDILKKQKKISIEYINLLAARHQKAVEFYGKK